MPRPVLSRLSGGLLFLLWAATSAPAAGNPNHYVFAHYMLCLPTYGEYLPGFKRDITDAQNAGIDGFVLDVGSWDGGDASYMRRVELMYQAAEQLNTGFKLSFFVDFVYETSNIVCMVTNYARRSPTFWFQNKVVLSAWGGGPVPSLGWPSADWTNGVILPLANAGCPAFFIPHFWPDPPNELPTYAQGQSVLATNAGCLSGLFLFCAAGMPPQIAQCNSNYNRAVHMARKTFMANCTPHYWGFAQPSIGRRYYETGGAQGLQVQWESLIASQPDWISLVTWNDFNESTYISPAQTPARYLPQISSPVRYSHAGYLEFSKRYITWFKTGADPGITRDALFYFYRTHSKDLVASDTNDVPVTWRYGDVEDVLYLTTQLLSPAQLEIYSGTNAVTNLLNAGMTHMQTPFSPGPQIMTLRRNGSLLLTAQGPDILARITNYDFFPASGFAYGNNVASPKNLRVTASGRPATSYYPLDAVPGALAAYSTYRLSSAYTGNALTLTNMSGGPAHTFGFNGDTVDTNAVFAWSDFYELTWFDSSNRVVNWFDQSGNGLDATQANAARWPRFYLAPDGMVSVWGPGYLTHNNVFQDLNLPPGLAVDTGNMSIYVVQRYCDHSFSGEVHTPWAEGLALGLGGITGLLLSQIGDGTIPSAFPLKVMIEGSGFNTTHTFRSPNLTVSVLSFRNNGSSECAIGLDNTLLETHPGIPGSHVTGGTIGSAANATQPGGGEILAVLYYPFHTDAQASNMIQVLRQFFGQAPAPVTEIVFDGDDVSAGFNYDIMGAANYYDSPGISWPFKLLSLLGRHDLVAWDLAEASLRINPGGVGESSFPCNLTTNGLFWVDPLLNKPAYSASLCVVCAGINDIIAGSTAPQVLAWASNYCAARKSAGWSKLVVGDLIPSRALNPTQEAQRQAYNAMLATQYVNFADALIVQSTNAWTNGFGTDWWKNYQTDTIHPNATGWAMMAATAKRVIQSLLP